MARVVVSEFITLDGVFEDPGGAEDVSFGGWAFRFDRGPDGDKFKGDELMAAEAQLLGRVTYEGFAAAWPGRPSDPFTDKMNAMPKYVVSSRLKDPGWENTTVLGDGWQDEVARLRSELTGDLLVAGSAQLLSGLLEADLLDELRLMTFPVVLGQGRRLFESAPEVSFAPVDARPAGQCTILTLQPAGRA